MQVIRLIKGNKQRTVARKLYEMILATRLELSYTKNQILCLYASLAPFGGNVVGLEAASWKPYSRDPFHLSWAETATLAVLPNAPSLIHPDKNREVLKEKRNNLLRKLLESGYIDSYEYDAAIIKPLPDKTYPLPQYARHLVNKLYAYNQGKSMVSTIDYHLQKDMENILLNHHKKLNYNHIHNIAALVIEINSGKVMAYAGNVYDAGQEHQNEVDIVQAARSPGSILKTMLYAASIEEGKITPESLIPDIPVRFSGYMPENFSKSYDGAVKAKQALARSLNVPAVLMLRQFGHEKFYNLLENIGISTLTYPAEHYGLSLILGGAEASLWEQLLSILVEYRWEMPTVREGGDSQELMQPHLSCLIYLIFFLLLNGLSNFLMK